MHTKTKWILNTVLHRRITDQRWDEPDTGTSSANASKTAGTISVKAAAEVNDDGGDARRDGPVDAGLAGFVVDAGWSFRFASRNFLFSSSMGRSRISRRATMRF